MKEEEYVLYVGNNCCICTNITEVLKEKGVNISFINIDQEEYELSFSLMIIPALVKSGKLIAYGPDILKVF